MRIQFSPLLGLPEPALLLSNYILNRSREAAYIIMEKNKRSKETKTNLKSENHPGHCAIINEHHQLTQIFSFNAIFGEVWIVISEPRGSLDQCQQEWNLKRITLSSILVCCILRTRKHRSILQGLFHDMEGQVVKQVPGLDLCQEQAKDQELNSAGTELKIRFVIVTMLEI